ncbi:glycosyltransferase [Salinisphaera japonica]|uniref:Glycosyl transferase n=1 Tax=Salinisphaera japonica YTM-1 TaxID=1209778 RepID=A0A423PL94_9GAMM|nr:glycosyltransferase [Salinisphaera japonica]ROO26366.1 hypothetical protein SAJA_11385 [Salinisphaera japonica YTM-1]
MTIIHVISEPNGGGAELLVRELNSRLNAEGVVSRVVYLTNPRRLPLLDNEYELGLTTPRDLRAGILLRQFILRSFDRDLVIHSHLTYPLYYVAVLPWPKRVRLVHTEHNTHNRRRDIALLRPIERRIYARFDAIVCISDGVHDTLANWIGTGLDRERLVTIPNGARLFAMRAGEALQADECGLTIISIGSLSRQKGFDISLAAVAKARSLVRRYIIVGEGNDRHLLEARVRDLGLADVVDMVGWQDNIGDWLGYADLMLIPSRWEGFGLVAIEALSTGLPIVASDVSGLGDILRGCEAVDLVSPVEPEVIAKAIERFAQRDDEQIRHLRSKARSHAEIYSLGSMADAYANLYETLT